VAFFEAPHKLRKTLEDLAMLVNRPIILARELTKIHEEFAVGTVGELLARFESPKGEFTVLIPPADSSEFGENNVTVAPEADVIALFGQITESGNFGSKRDAARATGERLGLTAKQVYEIIERNKLVE
jgi:16S rRNA (cytidine1402-2'-O)-methyltransferase